MPRGRLACRAARIRSRNSADQEQEPKAVWGKATNFVEKEMPRGRLACRAARIRSRLHSMSIRNLKRLVAKRPKGRKGRPATGRPSLSRENSSNGVRKRPSELSGEILLASERQCQGIFRE